MSAVRRRVQGARPQVSGAGEGSAAGVLGGCGVGPGAHDDFADGLSRRGTGLSEYTTEPSGKTTW